MTKTYRANYGVPCPHSRGGRHRVESVAESGWTHCVTERPDCGRAHGGLVFEQECACGAVRYVEANAGAKGYGPWRAST